MFTVLLYIFAGLGFGTCVVLLGYFLTGGHNPPPKEMHFEEARVLTKQSIDDLLEKDKQKLKEFVKRLVTKTIPKYVKRGERYIKICLCASNYGGRIPVRGFRKMDVDLCFELFSDMMCKYGYDVEQEYLDIKSCVKIDLLREDDDKDNIEQELKEVVLKNRTGEVEEK